MKLFLNIILLIIGFTICNSQTIEFQDKELERYFVNEKCCFDSRNPDSLFVADFNGDKNIQREEAELITNLSITDLQKKYTINSVSDLNYFQNIESLVIIYHDSLQVFRNMNFQSMNSLFISNCATMNYIDISNLTNLTKSLKIEGLISLDYLNIHNGSVADEFSMFYTINVKYACIDDIEKEKRILFVSGSMEEGSEPDLYCTNSYTNISDKMNIDDIVITNMDNELSIDTKLNILDYTIASVEGKQFKVSEQYSSNIDISGLTSGIYFIYLNTNNNTHIIKFIKP